MMFSRIFCSAILVVIGSLVLVNAGHHYNGGSNSHHGALNHYGGGGCYGHSCYNGAGSSAPVSNSRYGPYHSYAVRPVVYGGHGLYNYKGYARHHAGPIVHHRRPRNANHYNSAPTRHHGGCNGYDCGSGARHHGSANNLAAYSLKPVYALALIHPKPSHHYQSNNGANYRAAHRGHHGASGHNVHYGNGYGASAGNHGRHANSNRVRNSYGANHAGNYHHNANNGGY